jgi:hypothetical protein
MLRFAKNNNNKILKRLKIIKLLNIHDIKNII